MRLETLSIIKTSEGVQATYYTDGAHGEVKKQINVKYSDLAYPDDFMYACAYLIDEFATMRVNKPYSGRTVCIASPDEKIFKVGKIYEWKDGRTVDEKGGIIPTRTKLYSLDEITNCELKFIEIVED